MGSSAAAPAFMLDVATSITVLLAFSATIASSAADVPPYTNHTVGGVAGWIYNEANKAPATDYTAWATNQSFFLGDYLIFKTNGNSSVFQTYNATTYKNCSPEDDNGTLTSEYETGGGDIAVPLTREGDNYYLSGTFDGTQCQDGMKFQIKVGKGNGLPPSLNQPPPPPYVAPGPPPQQQAAAEATPSGQQDSFYRNGASGARRGLSLLGLVVTVMGLLMVFG